MTENRIKEIVAKYLPLENLKSLQISDNRIIAEFEQISENKQISEKLKQELATLFPEKKVNLLFTQKISSNIGIKETEKWKIGGVKHIIGVASGKGGVGKSTTAVNLALALSDKGLKVALVDADIYGPSVPTMLGYEGMPMMSADGVHFSAFNNYGVESVSIGSLIDRDTPIIWRGVKACGAIEQLVTQTNWGEIDVMVIDMPPGTGDIQITLSQKINFSGMVIVSTPQDIALIDAIKGINMFKKTGIEILGIVENMSYFICPHCGEKTNIFGHNGAKETAEKMGETFLGGIPLNMEIRETSDSGTPIVAANPDGEQAASYEKIAEKIMRKLGV